MAVGIATQESKTLSGESYASSLRQLEKSLIEAKDNKAETTLKAAYKVAVAEKGISTKEQALLDKIAAKSDGEFSAAYQTASLEDGISPTEIAALNKLLAIEDSFKPSNK